MLKKPMQKIVWTALAGLSLAIGGCGASKNNDTLTVGLQAGYPPYESVDENGTIIGFDIDVAKNLAALLHKKLIIRDMGFDSLILALKNHKIDLIVSGMSITADRLKAIEMIPYQGEQTTKLQLLFWNAAGCPIEFLKGKKVAVQSGTFQEQVLRGFCDVQLKLLENVQELVMDLKYGKSDAILVEPLIANELRHKYAQLHAIDVPLLPADQVLGNGIGIAKDNLPLKAAIETVVQELKTSGQLTELEHKWFHD